MITRVQMLHAIILHKNARKILLSVQYQEARCIQHVRALAKTRLKKNIKKAPRNWGFFIARVLRARHHTSYYFEILYFVLSQEFLEKSCDSTFVVMRFRADLFRIIGQQFFRFVGKFFWYVALRNNY